MNKGDLEKLREKLNSLISKKSDYSEILKVSQQLDDLIIEYTARSIGNKSERSTIVKQ